MNCKEYIDRLKQLQQDRFSFYNQQHKSHYNHQLNKQQYKYQAYIIDQMNHKNKLIAATQLRDTLALLLKTHQNDFLKKLSYDVIVQHAPNPDAISSMQSLRQEHAQFHNSREDTMTADVILVKLCSQTIKRQLEKAILQIKKDSFNEIQKYCKQKTLFNKVIKNTQKYHYRHSFKAILLAAAKLKSQLKIGTEAKIFDDQFSMIVKNDAHRKDRSKNLQESYFSLIIDKQNVNSSCPTCKEPPKATHHQQINKLTEELNFLKTLLTQKNLELKKRTEQCQKIRQYYESQPQEASRLQQYSDVQSRNSSFLSEMQRQVFGGRRIKKNGSRGSASQIHNRSEVSRQLLGKYMKQSFQLRQNIDIARQKCIELQQTVRGQQRKQLIEIIRILRPDDYQNQLVDQV